MFLFNKKEKKLQKKLMFYSIAKNKKKNWETAKLNRVMHFYWKFVRKTHYTADLFFLDINQDKGSSVLFCMIVTKSRCSMCCVHFLNFRNEFKILRRHIFEKETWQKKLAAILNLFTFLTS